MVKIKRQGKTVTKNVFEKHVKPYSTGTELSSFIIFMNCTVRRYQHAAENVRHVDHLIYKLITHMHDKLDEHSPSDAEYVECEWDSILERSKYRMSDYSHTSRLCDEAIYKNDFNEYLSVAQPSKRVGALFNFKMPNQIKINGLKKIANKEEAIRLQRDSKAQLEKAQEWSNSDEATKLLRAYVYYIKARRNEQHHLRSLRVEVSLNHG
jgi:hypothetical protein